MSEFESVEIPNISKRIQKVLDLRLENNKETLEALKELSTFFEKNTTENRRNLKSNITKRMLDIHEYFLANLEKAQDTLADINKDVNNMNMAINEMTNRLTNTKTKTRKLIDQTTHLQKQISDVEAKHQIAISLAEKFQLKPLEVSAIKSETVNIEMLEALDRCNEIKDSCQILQQAGCHILAQDIIQQMTILLEVGMERIYKWTKNRCRTIEQPDPRGLLPEALSKLQYREKMFNQVLEEYNTNRRDLLVRQLITALTRGGYPIEHRVTKPKRYISDMLAWLHQAVPAERDNLAYLLKKCDQIDVAEKIQWSLCSITEGVSHPLKVRIEHILVGENSMRDPLLLLEVMGLLRYYHSIIGQIVGRGMLEGMLTNLLETSERTLLMSLTARVALLLGSDVETAPTDLSLTPGVSKVLALLGQVLSLESTTASLVSDIVSCVVDPIFVHITERAVRLSTVESAVFLLNCFHALETSLALHPFLDERLERLKAQSEAQMDTLTSEQATALVAHLGLGAIYTALQGSSSKPLSKLPTFDSAHITAIGVKLHKMLLANDMYLLPQLALLSSTNCRMAIERRAGAVIHGIYTDLYNAVNDPENMFSEPENLLTIPPDNVLKVFMK